MFRYFGYGSNMNIHSLRAKGVEPIRSYVAVLEGWSLRFNVQHFFRHEGGVGNIKPNPGDKVFGVMHECHDQALEKLDEAEAYGFGYDRLNVKVRTMQGDYYDAISYIGMPSFIDNQCLPARRYLNILVDGAVQAGLDAAYIESLKNRPIHETTPYPPFSEPEGDFPQFTEISLANNSMYTGLYGAVFDMSDARPLHEYLKQFFGGRDMTLFHLKRLDNSTGNETMEDIKKGNLNSDQQRYINAYLHEYAKEYRYAGRINYN